MRQKIDFTKSFTKQLAKLPSAQRQKFYERLRQFQVDPFAPELRNHGLKGKYSGYRSIDIAWDLRALYCTRGDTIVIFTFIGTHSQLY
ncbi:MAG: type II toxin-antitoxin system RelE/ParE family toxin [Candidatus Saccharimonadales bacterium]